MDPEIEKIAYTTVAQQFAEDPDTIHAGTRFVEDLGADSSAIAELQAAVETRLGLDLSDEIEGAAGVATVGDFARMLDATVSRLRYSNH